MIRRELNIFLTSLVFFTRIPVKISNYDSQDLNKSSSYFPLIGWLVGLCTGLVFLGAQALGFSPALSILFSMVASVLLTGAFHEDGFADFCDGFGGGLSRQQVLEIMKDSRLGSYGALGLTLILLLKFFTLIQISELSRTLILPAFLLAHGLSRFFAVCFIFTMDYVRDSGKSKPLASLMSPGRFALALLLSFIPAALLIHSPLLTSFLALFMDPAQSDLYFLPVALLFFVVPGLFFLFFALRRFLRRKIGGYTGDCLGAAQQIAEVSIYSCIILSLRFVSPLTSLSPELTSWNFF